MHSNRNGNSLKRPKYALISPVRDEEDFIEATIRAVLEQTLRPVIWIIVSDGSRDRTDTIVQAHARHHPFIELVRLEAVAGRDFASKVHAFNHAYGLIWHRDFEFIGNLDGDVTLAPDYYEKALEEFKRNPRLGVAGGIVFENVGRGRYRRQDSSALHTPGATQVFRRCCLEAIGGYLPLRRGGEDSAADIMARMHGWQTRSFDRLRIDHHRRVGSGMGGLLRARFHAGMTDYTLGKHPLFVLLKSLRRALEFPPLLAGAARVAGFGWACVRREQRLVPPEFVRYVRREQLRRLGLNLRPLTPLRPLGPFSEAGLTNARKLNK